MMLEGFFLPPQEVFKDCCCCCFVFGFALNWLVRAFLHTRADCLFIPSLIPPISTSVSREPIRTGCAPSTVHLQWTVAINCPYFLHILKEVNFPKDSSIASYNFQHGVVCHSLQIVTCLDFLSPSEARGQGEQKVRFSVILQKELPDIQKMIEDAPIVMVHIKAFLSYDLYPQIWK